MQLGTRWRTGSPIPASVPAVLHDAIRAADADGQDASASWTLTWLEGRPIAERDSGIEVTLDADGAPVSRPWSD